MRLEIHLRHSMAVGRDSVVGTATRLGWTVCGSNPGGGEIFRTCPDRPWGPTSLSYNWYRVIPGGKAAGAWRWPPTPPSSAEVKKRVEIYIYSPSVPSRQVIGWILTLKYGFQYADFHVLRTDRQIL
jgi:hypothetical protein